MLELSRPDNRTKLSGLSPEEKLAYLKREHPEKFEENGYRELLLLRLLSHSDEDFNRGSDSLSEA